jgi:L-rhamnose mutarotase
MLQESEMSIYRVFVKQENVYDMVVLADSQEEAESIALSDLDEGWLQASSTMVYESYEIEGENHE